MRRISFGLALYGTEGAQRGVQLARVAEDFGYQRLWVGDSHMIWRELYVLLGAIAMVTKRLQIGPGVTHPEVRHLTVTATAMVTLNELSEGRALLGFGVGATGPGNIGMKPVSVEQLQTAVTLLKQLMAGEAVQFDGKNARCVYACPDPIPIYIGTRSPRAIEMSARLANGIIYTGELSSLQPLVKTAWQYAGEQARSREDFNVIYRIPCSIADNASEAREAVKGKIARSAMTHLGRLHRQGELHDEEDRRAVERLWQQYDTYHHMGPEHSHLVRDEWVDRFAIAGTPDQVREKACAIASAGVDEITIVPFGSSKESVVKRFAKEVIAKV